MERLIKKTLGSYLNAGAWLFPELASRHAFELFCYPFRPKLQAHHREFLANSEKFSFSHNNVRLQGYRWGSGKRNVLFLHGWQSHSFRWKNYINKFPADEYSVFAFDAPGHGFSGGRFLTVPLYSEIISSFVKSKGRMDTIVGHSIGSFSLLHALHHEPSLEVDRVILMAPPGEGSDFFDFFTQTLRLSPKMEGLALNYFERQVRKPISYYSATRFAKSLRIPGLIIHDSGDKEVSYRHGVNIHRVWNGSKLVATEGLGHNLRSADVISTVIQYITQDDSVDHEDVRAGMDQSARPKA